MAETRQGGLGKTRQGAGWHGMAVEAWCGRARLDKTWRLRRGAVRYDRSRHGGLGKARLDMLWRGGHSLIILNVREV